VFALHNHFVYHDSKHTGTRTNVVCFRRVLRTRVSALGYLRLRQTSSLSQHPFAEAKLANHTPRKLMNLNPYPTAFPYANGIVLHFYQQQDSSTTKTVHKVINRGLKAYVQSLQTGENFH